MLVFLSMKPQPCFWDLNRVFQYNPKVNKDGINAKIFFCVHVY